MPRVPLGGERSLAAWRGGLRRQLCAAAGGAAAWVGCVWSPGRRPYLQGQVPTYEAEAAVLGGAFVSGKASFVYAPWPVCTCRSLPALDVYLFKLSSSGPRMSLRPRLAHRLGRPRGWTARRLSMWRRGSMRGQRAPLWAAQGLAVSASLCRQCPSTKGSGATARRSARC